MTGFFYIAVIVVALAVTGVLSFKDRYDMMKCENERLKKELRGLKKNSADGMMVPNKMGLKAEKEVVDNNTLKDGEANLKALEELFKLPMERAGLDAITSLYRIAEEIVEGVQKHPENSVYTKSFFSYYLPATVKLANKYSEFSILITRSAGVHQAKQDILESLQSLEPIYVATLNKLYENDVMDVSADMKALKDMITKDANLQRDVWGA